VSTGKAIAWFIRVVGVAATSRAAGEKEAVGARCTAEEIAKKLAAFMRVLGGGRLEAMPASVAAHVAQRSLCGA